MILKPTMPPDATDALIRGVTDLAARSDVEREVIEAALRSVSSAMERVAPDARTDLQSLVSAFVADPEDKDIVARLGALLR